MKIGKLTTEQLKNLVFSTLNKQREEVMVRPNVGEDCAIIDFGEYACVMSTDPITGTAEEIGKLAIHITCNDIASSGARPLGIMLTIMAPEETKEEEIKKIMEDASREASKLNVEIIGGHTEITNAVNRIVISSTGIGKELKKNLKKDIPKEGDLLVLTKGAGIEGTGIICFEKEKELKSIYGENSVREGKELLNKISVVKEGIIGGKIGVSFMHDVTEGGVLGGVWEICDLYKLGCTIYEEKIHIHPATRIISNHYKINPLRLISSGSMLIGIDKEKLEVLKNEFEKEDIAYTVIGELNRDEKKMIVVNGKEKEINPPESDELYKVI